MTTRDYSEKALMAALHYHQTIGSGATTSPDDIVHTANVFEAYLTGINDHFEALESVATAAERVATEHLSGAVSTAALANLDKEVEKVKR